MFFLIKSFLLVSFCVVLLGFWLLSRVFVCV